MLLILRHPKFRLFWIAGAFGDVSLVTYFTVHGWLALDVTNSPFWVGAVAGIGGVALTVFAPWGGVLIDRFQKIDVVRVSSLFRAVAAAAIAALIFTDSIQLWHVLLMPIAAGVTGAVRIPGMMTLNMDIVGRENLLSATAARFASMTIVGVAVPLAVGPVIENVGIGWAYVAIALGDTLSAALMSVIDLPHSEPSAERRSPLQDLKTGLGYAFRNPLVRIVLGVVLINELFGWSHEPMLPVVARDVLGEDASGLGKLLAATSAGAAATSIAISAFRDIDRKGWLMIGGVLGFGCSLIAFSLSRSLLPAMAFLALAGGFAGLYETVADTAVQAGVADQMRGRVLSLQATMWGLSAVTGFHTGAIAAVLGPSLAIGIGGGVLILAALGLTRFARTI